MLGEGFVRLFGYLLVHCAQKRRQTFEDGHFRTQTAPDRAHFQANHAGTNQTQLLGHCAHLQGAIVGQHVDFIERDARQRAGVRSGGHNDVVAGDSFFSSTRYFDFVARIGRLHEGATSVQEGDLVLFQQVQNPVVVLLNDGVLAGNHLGHVHLHVFGADAVLGEVVVGMVEMLAGLQQRLGRNATDIGAGAAGCGAALVVLPLINTGHAKAQLGSTDGCDIAAGASANHDDVKTFTH